GRRAASATGAAMTTQTETSTVVTASPQRPGRTRKPGERRLSVLNILAFVALVLLAIGWLLPFLWAVATAFKTETDAAASPPSWIGPNGITVDAFTAILSQGNVWIWAGNSLWTSAAITIITLAISALA